MSIFLIVYSRKTGHLESITRFPEIERPRAQAERLRVELSLLSSLGDREVVLLEAPSREALEDTHGRYFQGVEALVERVRKAAA